MGVFPNDNSLDCEKQPQHRVFRDLFTERMSEITRKNRAKVLLFSGLLLYFKFGNIELAQLGWVKFTSNSLSPTPVLAALLTYFFIYFVIGSLVDNKKYYLAKSFESWERFEGGFASIAQNLEEGGGESHERIKTWLEKVNSKYEESKQTSKIQSFSYWIIEISLPILSALLALVA